jgi:hypothetical protein
MGLGRDEDVNAVAVMDEVEGQMELQRLADLLKHNKFGANVAT